MHKHKLGLLEAVWHEATRVSDQTISMGLDKFQLLKQARSDVILGLNLIPIQTTLKT